MDQYASKIVEKCLKIGGLEFLDRYLSRVCTGRSDRPRMPLIDSGFTNGLFFSLSQSTDRETVAGDQYGNYLIQWILMNAAAHQREVVASHIRYQGLIAYPQEIYLLTFPFKGNIWSLFEGPSLALVWRCSAATRLMPRALVQEPACRSVVSINSMKKNSPHVDRAVAASTEAINGALLTRRSVESTGADFVSFARLAPNDRKERETKKRKEQKTKRKSRQKLLHVLITLTFTCRYLDLCRPVNSQLFFISAEPISQAPYACRSIYLAC